MLKKHPIVASLLSLLFIDFPQWAPSVWSMFSSEPMFIVIRRNMGNEIAELARWGPTVIGIVGIIVVIVLVLRTNSAIPKQLGSQGVPALRSLPGNYPAVRPYEYGKEPQQNLYGLFVTNPGYAAFDVHIPPVEIGRSGYMLTFRETLAQLLERDHKRFISAWLEHATLPGRDGGDLFAIMREAHVDLLHFRIVYKDNAAEPNKHRTNCSIERDVEITGGLRVRYINQELVEEWEPAGRGGPELVVSYKAPTGTSVAGKSKEMFLENASDTDAHNVKLHDISIAADDSVIATFPLLPRLRARSEEQLTCNLTGSGVPPSRLGEFEMIFYAVDTSKPGIVELGDGGRMWMTFPILVSFEDYAGDRYRAEFEFRSDDWFLYSTTRLLGRQKLKRRLA